jgi:hypothetical protein
MTNFNPVAVSAVLFTFGWISKHVNGTWYCRPIHDPVRVQYIHCISVRYSDTILPAIYSLCSRTIYIVCVREQHRYTQAKIQDDLFKSDDDVEKVETGISESIEVYP